MATTKKKLAVKEKSKSKEEPEKEPAKERVLESAKTNVANVDVTEQTLERTPERAVTLLRGIGTIPEVQAQLQRYGYNEETHRRAWSLLEAASGFSSDATLWKDKSVADAIAAIDATDEKLYAIVGGMLKHSYPKQHGFLFGDLRASKGVQSVAGMQRFLARLSKLEAGKATDDAKQDKEAFAMLSSRGIDEAKRKELAGWLETAVGLSDDSKRREAVSKQEEQEKKRREALVALRAWYEEWSEITRASVSRRDFLIRLGLAQPKRRETPHETPEDPSDPA